MPNRDQFKSAARLAVKNVINYGDTDIFPYPFERFVFQDNFDEVVGVIEEYNDNFEEYLVRYSPLHVSSLSPVNYFGFRWATQLDYIWNAYFLACVLSLRDSIEAARIPIQDQMVFSYRLEVDKSKGSLFSKETGFAAFMKKSADLSQDYPFVAICDISEFYPRLGHHRLESALKQIDNSSDYPGKIMKFLANFSKTNSFGLPIGGPAARILSELTINQIDRLLLAAGIRFTRFADDFHLFASSREEAYLNLIFLSEKLSTNQGLMLQKSKTRIMSSGEFRSTIPTPDADIRGEGPGTEIGDDQKSESISAQRQRLASFSLRFDPYSPTREDDYEKLRAEIKKYDILEILKEELGKTRVHTALTRKLIGAIKYLEPKVRDQAVLSVLDNSEVLYPIYASVLMMIDSVVGDMSTEVKAKLKAEIVRLISSESHVFRVDVHMCFAVRVLAHFNDPEVIALLQRIYRERTSPIIRRDIILTLARWGEWYWLSDIKNSFRQLSVPEQNAFILSSYPLREEGRHWRDHARVEFNPYQKVVLSWASGKVADKGWKISL